jgi:hypothetical protein
VDDDAEIPAAFARLRDEVRGAPPSRGLSAAEARAERLAAREQAERYWSVSAERPFVPAPGGRGRARALVTGPLRVTVRRLLRWYVEPALAAQRQFNEAALRLLDDLDERVAALEAREGGNARDDA